MWLWHEPWHALFSFPLLYCLAALHPKSQLRHLNIHTLTSLLPVRLPTGCGPSPSSAQKREPTHLSVPTFISNPALSYAPDKQAFQPCQFHIQGGSFHSCSEHSSMALFPAFTRHLPQTVLPWLYAPWSTILLQTFCLQSWLFCSRCVTQSPIVILPIIKTNQKPPWPFCLQQNCSQHKSNSKCSVFYSASVFH